MGVVDVVNCRNFTPYFQFMKNVVPLEEIQTKIIKQLQLQPLARIMNRCVGNNRALTAAAECLDRYGFTERIAQIYYEEGAVKIVLEYFPLNLKDPEFI